MFFKHILFCYLLKQIKCRDVREQVTCVPWKHKKCKTTLFLLIKTVLNKDEDYPTPHKTRSDPARLKDSSYTAPSEGTEAIKLVQNTVHSYGKRWGSLGNSAHEPLVSKAFGFVFFKAAQVNKEQGFCASHKHSGIPIKTKY